MLMQQQKKEKKLNCMCMGAWEHECVLENPQFLIIKMINEDSHEKPSSKWNEFWVSSSFFAFNAAFQNGMSMEINEEEEKKRLLES